MRIAGWLERWAHARPDRVAVAEPGAARTYAQLAAAADGVAAALAARGARAGDRVAIALPPGVAFAEVLHGCLALGAAAMPVDLRLGAAERARIEASARVVVDAPVSAGAHARPRHAATGRPGDHVALVMHTSGTTRAPRPIELTLGNVQASALGAAGALGHDPAERWLCPLPVSHVAGLMILLRCAIHGTTALIDPPPFDAAATAARIAGDGVTLVSLVPTQLARLLDAGLARPQALRGAILGGGPADPALLRRAAAAGVPVAQTYGLTETCSMATTSEPGRPETAGRPLPGVDVELAPDGEILLTGPVIAPAALAADGRLHTGDLGVLGPDGLRIVGRKADTIVTGGENVAPAEVEAALLEHPAVAEAGVYARPDPEWGEAVVARVVLRDGGGDDTTPAALREHVARRLVGYKVPKAVELSTEPLPRTASGKLLRRALPAPGCR